MLDFLLNAIAVHPHRAPAARRSSTASTGSAGDAGRLRGARLRHRHRDAVRVAVHDALRDPGARPAPAAARAARGWRTARDRLERDARLGVARRRAGAAARRSTRARRSRSAT